MNKPKFVLLALANEIPVLKLRGVIFLHGETLNNATVFGPLCILAAVKDVLRVQRVYWEDDQDIPVVPSEALFADAKLYGLEFGKVAVVMADPQEEE